MMIAMIICLAVWCWWKLLGKKKYISSLNCINNQMFFIAFFPIEWTIFHLSESHWLPFASGICLVLKRWPILIQWNFNAKTSKSKQLIYIVLTHLRWIPNSNTTHIHSKYIVNDNFTMGTHSLRSNYSLQALNGFKSCSFFILFVE